MCRSAAIIIPVFFCVFVFVTSGRTVEASHSRACRCSPGISERTRGSGTKERNISLTLYTASAFTSGPGFSKANSGLVKFFYAKKDKDRPSAFQHCNAGVSVENPDIQMQTSRKVPT